jgi:hypothetical protein
MTRDRGFKLGGLLVAIVALAPFLRMIAGGQSLFFRDLSVFYFPLRRFLLEGLALWEWRAWNPFVHDCGINPLIPRVASRECSFSRRARLSDVPSTNT